ncbi:cupin domain-containing protein [Pseudomonas sp.]|uniref:cupin domain-containing protein n=1 Tax=Pseudomonas sp. TaxID=306 RepID=UPI001B023058|nr:cupin domain-containing protein [Pseudomonas sp.]MBO9547951.1 cupin domain-containing protein [Pseudomonas sp.]
MLPDRLNADLTLPAIMHGADLPWLASPLPGVERRPLFRIGGEKARATSLVRYAPGSHFSAHQHPGGEEFVVLEGVFEDERGRYPVGSYVRNPPGSAHAPKSSEGCTIFVRLQQFHPEDDQQLVATLSVKGDQVLFSNAHEQVYLKHLQPGAPIHLENPRGLECLLLQGSLHGTEFSLHSLSWMRLPTGTDMQACAGPNGARLWLKDAPPSLGL